MNDNNNLSQLKTLLYYAVLTLANKEQINKGNEQLVKGLCEYSLGFQESQFGECVKHDVLFSHLIDVA